MAKGPPRRISANPRISWTIGQLGGCNAVARELGLSASTVSRWTEPHRRASRPAGVPAIGHLLDLIKLARSRQIDVDMTWLLDGKKDLDNATSENA